LQIKVDLHVHSDRSNDSSITIPEAIAMARRRGLQGIAVTDHDAATRTAQYSSSDFLLVPGIEVSTSEGHLLGIGVDQPIPSRLQASETADRVREAGGLAVVSHPFSLMAQKIDPRVIEKGRFDAVEVMNASYPLFQRSSRFGRALAERLDLPQVGGSDSHILETIGDAFTVIEAESLTVEGVLKAIRNKKVHPEGRASSITNQLRKAFSILRLRLR
jgi:predicted metal-dependent phosphoesterase TrpH